MGTKNEVTELFAKVYDFNEFEVCMDCLVDDGIFEERSFQYSPIFKEMELTHGMFMKLKLTSGPGFSKIEIEPVEEDLSHLFPEVDFGDLKDSAIFKDFKP